MFPKYHNSKSNNLTNNFNSIFINHHMQKFIVQVDVVTIEVQKDLQWENFPSKIQMLKTVVF